MPGLEFESAFIPRVVALPESNRSPLPLGGVSGMPTLIQSRCGTKGNFELLTPMASGGLAHYWRNNDEPAIPWHGPAIFGRELGIVASVSFMCAAATPINAPNTWAVRYAGTSLQLIPP